MSHSRWLWQTSLVAFQMNAYVYLYCIHVLSSLYLHVHVLPAGPDAAVPRHMEHHGGARARGPVRRLLGCHSRQPTAVALPTRPTL